jgi:drug/metabolite transporter (DMT)-like permease
MAVMQANDPKWLSKGVKMMLIASVAFALMNLSVKRIAHIPVFEVILARVIISFIISYATVKYKGIYPWGKHKKFLIARGLFGACGLIAYYYTLQHMALANAIVIHYLSPIFTGVVMVKGFANVSGFDFMMGIVAALFTGLAYNAIRNMKDQEHADVIVLYHPLITFPIVVMYFFLFPADLVWPNGIDWLYLFGTGIFTQIGQYFMTRAYQNDTAARVSSVSYIGIIWGVLLGITCFNDHYPIAVMLGICLVLLGVLVNLNAERLKTFAIEKFQKH